MTLAVRPTLSLLAVFALTAANAALGQAQSQNKHFRGGNLTRPCTPCHGGHGLSRTPMLRTDGDQLCTGCHSGASASPAARVKMGVNAASRPADIRSEMTKAYAHGKARCLDCHSAHFGSASTSSPVSELSPGVVKPSPRRGFRTEVELCLSCHDGSIALGATLANGTIGMSGGITTMPVTSSSYFGRDLSGHHPISFTVTTALISANNAKDSPLKTLDAMRAGTVARLDRQDRVQCASCHDPHRNPYNNNFLRAANEDSICLTCHG